MQNTLSIRLPFVSRILLSQSTNKAKIILISLTALLFVLLAVYILQLGQWIQSEYTVNKYQADIQQIQADNLGLKTQIDSNLLSQNAEQEMAKSGYVKVEKITYLPIINSHLAQK